jgi:hypothetical protein
MNEPIPIIIIIAICFLGFLLTFLFPSKEQLDEMDKENETRIDLEKQEREKKISKVSIPNQIE